MADYDFLPVPHIPQPRYSPSSSSTSHAVVRRYPKKPLRNVYISGERVGERLTPILEEHQTRQAAHHMPPHTSPPSTWYSSWTATASTLAVGSPDPLGEITDSSETAALKLRVSQLEATVEELKRCVDILTAGKQGVSIPSMFHGPW